MNACLPVSLCGWLYAQYELLTGLVGWDGKRESAAERCREDKLELGTEDERSHRRADETQTVDLVYASDWRSRNVVLTSVLTGQKEIQELSEIDGLRLSVFPGQTKTVCWCLGNLDECQHHALPADLSWWLMGCKNMFWCMCVFYCAYVGVLRQLQGSLTQQNEPITCVCFFSMTVCLYIMLSCMLAMTLLFFC